MFAFKFRTLDNLLSEPEHDSNTLFLMSNIGNCKYRNKDNKLIFTITYETLDGTSSFINHISYVNYKYDILILDKDQDMFKILFGKH